MTGSDPQDPADPQKAPDSGPFVEAPDGFDPLRRLFTCPECHFDYSRSVQVVLAAAGGFPVTAFIKPARCPECKVWLIRPGLAVIQGGRRPIV